jgi:DNA-binding IclR family transcriptional regulator
MNRSANIQSVERAFAVLRAIGVNGRATPLGVIAAETGLPKSTVSRLLGTMVGIGAVEKVAGGEYSIGSELRAIVLPAVGQADLISIAATYLRAVVDEIDEDVGLAIPDGDSILYIDQVQSPNPVMVQDWTGERYAMHTTAAGYVALAALEDAELDRYLSGELESLSSATETDPDKLREHITTTRKNGYAWIFEVWAQGINGAAAPIRNAFGEVVASINLFGPAYRFPGDADTAAIGVRLVEVADQISRHLGEE